MESCRVFRPRNSHPLRPRRRRSLRPLLEDLETRMALAVSTVVPGAEAVASVLMDQSFQIGQPPTEDSGSLTASQHESQVQPLLAIASSGLTPQQISTAYGINQIRFGDIKGDGTGVTIAIVAA